MHWLQWHLVLEAQTTTGVLNLSVESQTTTQVKSILGLGLHGDYSFKDRLNLSPTLRIGWAHEFADRSADTSASFSSAPLIAFQGQGPEKSRDEARLHLDLIARSLEAADDYDLSAYAAYDGALATTHQNHALTAGLKFKWLLMITTMEPFRDRPNGATSGSA